MNGMSSFIANSNVGPKTGSAVGHCYECLLYKPISGTDMGHCTERGQIKNKNTVCNEPMRW